MAEKNIERAKESRQTVQSCCDVFEKDGAITLRLEMPGVTKEGLSINIDGDRLEIRGRRDIAAKGQGTYLVREIRDADFYQVYTIDETIDRNRIDASMKNGVLLLKLTKKESEKPRRIQITAK